MKRIILFLALALCTSCSLKLQDAAVEVPNDYIYNHGFSHSESPISESWWESFGDERLNELIEYSLHNNNDLAAAVAAVEASRSYLKAARAEFAPSLSFDATTEIVHELQSTLQEYTVAPTLSWEISLFGKLRNTKKAAAASLMQQEWNLRGVWLSLSAEVATAYFTLLQYRRNLYIATRSYELRRTATALVDSMYYHGMSNGTDLMQARSLVYAAQIEMQKYKRATIIASLSLSTLLGEIPHESGWSDTGRALISDNLPLNIPVGLPSSLLERRPDVMQSYYAMSQAAAEVGISRAARYPSISLTAGGGVYATALKKLTSGDPLYWSTTAGIVQPLFNWGALKRKEIISREKYTASVENYEQTVLEAFKDVESALITIETCSSETAATTALVVANTKIAENTNALYTSGLGNYLSVIDAERELYASQISLVEIVAQQYINYIDLLKALGGGW